MFNTNSTYNLIRLNSRIRFTRIIRLPTLVPEFKLRDQGTVYLICDENTYNELTNFMHN